MNSYTITKIYQGGRWETKDYFYTLERLSTIQMDEPMGTTFEDVLSLIWEY